MLYGIGVDCVQLKRMAKSLQKPHFVARVFSLQEQALLAGLGEKRKTEAAAGCFAAKEAFLKAAGVGLGGFALGDIAALRYKTGAPYYAFGGTAAAYMQKNGLRAHLSLTHEKGLAMAFAVLEAE